MTIPKTLHFTAKSKTLSRFAQRTWNAWARTHRDWQMKLWDDADIRALVAEHYPQHLAVFDGYPKGIFRADAFRVFVLHKFGGVYSDLDVLPLARIDGLLEISHCFVGSEPEVQVDPTRGCTRGIPFVLCNAFMGSVPGHVFWERCLERLERCSATSDVLDATGPRFINGVALCISRDERPGVLAPSFWSPIMGNGKPGFTSSQYCDALETHFTVIGRDEPPIVSHLWRNSWSMPIAYKGPEFWRLPNILHWGWRRFRNPDLVATTFKGPERTYDEQIVGPITDRPPLYVALDLSDGLQRAVEALLWLDYPKDCITVGLFGGGYPDQIAPAREAIERAGIITELLPGAEGLPQRHNAMLDASRGKGHFVLMDGSLRDMPANTLQTMLGVGRPVVVVDVVDEDGNDRNDQTYLYGQRLFKNLYRARERVGSPKMRAGRSVRPLLNFRYLNIAPVTTIGSDLILIREEVVAAGVRFAEAPYKLHLDSQGFALMARDKGFEVAALPNHTVVTSRASLV